MLDLNPRLGAPLLAVKRRGRGEYLFTALICERRANWLCTDFGCRFRMFSERIDDRSWGQIYLQAVLVKGLLVWVLVIWNTLREFGAGIFAVFFLDLVFRTSQLLNPSYQVILKLNSVVWWQGSNGDLGCKKKTHFELRGKQKEGLLGLLPRYYGLFTTCWHAATRWPCWDSTLCPAMPRRYCCCAGPADERKVAFNKGGLKPSSFSSFFIPVFLPFFCSWFPNVSFFHPNHVSHTAAVPWPEMMQKRGTSK